MSIHAHMPHPHSYAHYDEVAHATSMMVHAVGWVVFTLTLFFLLLAVKFSVQDLFAPPPF